MASTAGPRPAMAPLGLNAIQKPLRQRHHHPTSVITCAGHATIRSSWSVTLGQPALNAVLNHPRATTIPITLAAQPEHHIPRFRALALLRREQRGGVTACTLHASEKPTHKPTLVLYANWQAWQCGNRTTMLLFLPCSSQWDFAFERRERGAKTYDDPCRRRVWLQPSDGRQRGGDDCGT